MNVTFRPNRSASLPPSKSRLPKRQGVGRDYPLPVHRGEVQGALRGRQRDTHHRDVEDDHELRDADHAEDEPAPSLLDAADAADAAPIWRRILRLDAR
jgi:hypothetical protein